MRFCYPVPELVEGSNLHLLTVAHASGSDLIILLLISVSLLLSFSVFFRVHPWLILLLISVSLFLSFSVFFRVIPWLKPTDPWNAVHGL